MDDPYPSHFEIQIDRTSLLKYLRVKWFLSWFVILGLFGAIFSLAGSAKIIDQGLKPWTEISTLIVSNAAIGAFIALLLAAMMYLLFSHRLATCYASTLSVSVEGPFLRVREFSLMSTDRRIHFRAVVDYAVQEDWLMRRFGIQALKMNTTGRGEAATITIPAVKDCLKTRDQLSEVDSLRED